jgi:hypothetical protein
VYQRLYHATGDRRLRDAAREWVLQILAYVGRSDRGDRVGDERLVVPGLMNGAAGAALVLLAASSDVRPDWDRALLLGD